MEIFANIKLFLRKGETFYIILNRYINSIKNVVNNVMFYLMGTQMILPKQVLSIERLCNVIQSSPPYVEFEKDIHGD